MLARPIFVKKLNNNFNNIKFAIYENIKTGSVEEYNYTVIILVPVKHRCKYFLFPDSCCYYYYTNYKTVSIC